jgi:hypothetical protein
VVDCGGPEMRFLREAYTDLDVFCFNGRMNGYVVIVSVSSRV